jgi:hypothetical protein
MTYKVEAIPPRIPKRSKKFQTDLDITLVTGFALN